jgi:aminopeptidase-like protein
MWSFVEELFPVCRSVTGNGVRQTLARVQEEVPLTIIEVPTGTRVFDWQVPKEWNIRSAYIERPDGGRIADFSDNNLHIVSYSAPLDRKMPLHELDGHLHSIDKHPFWIPYRTSYYNESWGFCLAHKQRTELKPGTYRAYVDSDLTDGHLTYGELCIPGSTDKEIIIYSHICHPSLANDNLSGLAVSVWWAKYLLESGTRRHTYRFVWGPGTIGSITWLARNEQSLHKIEHGLSLVLLGRPGKFCYKRSRKGNEEIDQMVTAMLGNCSSGMEIRDFEPYGYDERQFCSPGINLSFGRLSRAPNGEYDEYHTSADNLELISPSALAEALDVCKATGDALNSNRTFKNLAPMCEPQLGKRGLYRSTGGGNPKQRESALRWVLNFSDGEHSLLDISNLSEIPFAVICEAARDLEAASLIA